jgi:NADPH:quinone reductase-like Zn-dependent oxidoreductase
MSNTYRAVVFSEYGDPDVLRLVDLDAPEPGPGQVRIAVRAASVNPLDWKLRSGAMAEFMPVAFPAVPGVDVAGVIDRVGEGVSEFAVGAEVFGKTRNGSYAELALAGVDTITAKPAEVPWEVAAALPVAASTAHHALAQLDLTDGETIVIDGAAGGVGTLAVQVAHQRGLSVIGTASPSNHEYLRSLGAIPVTYGEGLADRIRAINASGADAALDAAGHGSLPELIDITGDSERVITIADPSAGTLGVRFVSGEPDHMADVLAETAASVAAGTITLPIARTYPLSEAADAHRDSQAGHVRGKLILLPR